MPAAVKMLATVKAFNYYLAKTAKICDYDKLTLDGWRVAAEVLEFEFQASSII
jgi:hypothetical protein